MRDHRPYMYIEVVRDHPDAPHAGVLQRWPFATLATVSARRYMKNEYIYVCPRVEPSANFDVYRGGLA